MSNFERDFADDAGRIAYDEITAELNALRGDYIAASPKWPEPAEVGTRMLPFGVVAFMDDDSIKATFPLVVYAIGLPEGCRSLASMPCEVGRVAIVYEEDTWGNPDNMHVLVRCIVPGVQLLKWYHAEPGKIVDTVWLEV